MFYIILYEDIFVNMINKLLNKKTAFRFRLFQTAQIMGYPAIYAAIRPVRRNKIDI